VDNEDSGFARGSGVNYSKVADRHVDDKRYEKHRPAPAPAMAESSSTTTPPPGSAAPVAKVSAQMDAVMRLMAGMEERTLSEKMADSNRPTWEQYKKDNEDKLDIVGVDQKKMDAYRRELDEQRDKILSRGLNHGGGSKKDDKKKSSKKKKKRRHRHSSSDTDEHSSDDDDDSEDDDSRGRKHGAKRKKKRKHRSSRKHKRHRHDRDSESASSDDYSSDDSRRRSKHKKKKSRKSDKKKSKKEGDVSTDEGYRLSSFFTKGADEADSD
jgi:hypothetical protein